MRVYLIGGDCNGEYAPVPDEFRCDQPFLVARRPPMTAYDPNEMGPSTTTSYTCEYRLRTIHLNKNEFVYYGIPVHWKDNDGLTALFGQIHWRNTYGR
jgi:hypothetical protein